MRRKEHAGEDKDNTTNKIYTKVKKETMEKKRNLQPRHCVAGESGSDGMGQMGLVGAGDCGRVSRSTLS